MKPAHPMNLTQVLIQRIRDVLGAANFALRTTALNYPEGSSERKGYKELAEDVSDLCLLLAPHDVDEEKKN
jgi:hypothetical protein